MTKLKTSSAPAAVRVLVVARRDVAQAFANDPAASRYLLDTVPPGTEHTRAAEFAIALVEVATNDDVAIGRRLRRENTTLEWLALAEDDRLGAESVKAGAFDYARFPAPDPVDLWAVLARVFRRVAPSGDSIPAKVGRYRTVRRLGAGGMAEVFLAQGPDGPVVVKCLLPEVADDPDFVQMFMDEAKVSSQLEHPNIVRILDFGKYEGRLFMALQYVAGSNLAQVGRANGWKFPIGPACEIVAQVCAALHHAHGRADAAGRPLSIVHRDVNPPNILLSEEGRALLSDFGIAKTTQSHSQTTHGAVKGKFDYLSPEQVEGATVDRRSDVFSLGIVLYYLLTGVHPFRWSAPFKTMLRIRQGVFDRPSHCNAAIPAHLENVVLRALARDRDARYPDAASFERELRASMATGGWAAGPKELAALLTAKAPPPAAVPVDPGSDSRIQTVRRPGAESVILERPSKLAEEPPHRDTKVGVPGLPQEPPASEDTMRSLRVPGPSVPSRAGAIPEPSLRSDPSLTRPGFEELLSESTVTTVTTATPVPVPVPEVSGTHERQPEATVSGEVKIPEEEDPFAAFARKPETNQRTTVGAPLSPAAGARPLSAPVREAARAREEKDPLATPRRRGRGIFALVAVASIAGAAAGSRMLPRETAAPVSSPASSPTPYAGPADSPVATRDVVKPTATVALAARTSVPPRTPPPSTATTPRPTARTVVTPPPPPRKGTLTIWVTGGWAAVTIDGQSIGQNAPIVGLELSEGKHRVLLENGAAGFRREYEVNVIAGEEARLGVALP